MTKNIKELCASKPVAIFGTGASGAAAKRLFDSLGIEAVFYAESGAELFDSNAARRHALVVYSPAFRPGHPWIAEAQKNGSLAICEPDLSALAWRGKIYAITGTNGKTTITKFLAHAFSLAGFGAVAAGNVGKPLSAFCAELDGGGGGKIAICELSSFQTSNLRFLKPDALLWTNFAPDHLDWHKDMREYFFAKFNIVEAALGKPIVAGSSVAQAAKEYGAELPAGVEIFDESLKCSAPEPFSSSIQARNFAMAEMLAKKIGLSRESLLKAAESFSLPEYRFSAPEEIGGIRFYNDSKATNAHAAIAALEELAGENDLIWIGGGKDKNCDIEELAGAVAKRAKAAVLIGQTAEKLKSALSGRLARGAHVCGSMGEAVRKAAELAKKGSCVLFSPGFSSFGMFKGYADRGKSFKNEVLCLKNLK